jgi:hypothetical protein
MPKRTLALIIFLIVATVGLVALSVYNKPQAPEPTTIVKKPLIPAYAQTTFVLSDTITPDLTRPGQFKTEILIDTGTNKITATQLELSYDPKDISNVTITPGTFIKNPTVLLKKVDPTLGRISLAIGINMGESGISGVGQIATISFMPNAGIRTTKISFLPTTQAAAEGIAKDVIKSKSGATITIDQPTSAATNAAPLTTTSTSPGE